VTETNHLKIHQAIYLAYVVGTILQQNNFKEEIHEDRMDENMDQTHMKLVVEKAKAQTLWKGKNDLWTRMDCKKNNLHWTSKELQLTARQCSKWEIPNKQC